MCSGLRDSSYATADGAGLHAYLTCRAGLKRQSSGGFRGGPSRLRPPPLGRRTDAVTHGHGTQNIQNYCHQWLSGSFRVHQILFQWGLLPRPHWGNLQRSPRPTSWFKGPYFLGGGDGGREERKIGREQKGKGRNPPFANSWIRPCSPTLSSSKRSPFFGRRQLRKVAHLARCRPIRQPRPAGARSASA